MKPAVKILPSGARLVVAPNPHRKTTAIVVGVGLGSRHEPEGLHGAAHFLEHMVFKGTRRRPSSKAICGPLEAHGSSLDAYTDKELTTYECMIAKENAPMALDAIHDVLVNALLREEDMEAERNVILDEISTAEEDPECTATELSQAHAYDGTGLAHRILGEDVPFTAAELRRLYEEWYQPPNVVIALAGAVDERVVQHASSLFGNVSNWSLFDAKPSIDAARRARVNIERGDLMIHRFVPGCTYHESLASRLSVVVGFPGLASAHPDSMALAILSKALGGYSSARLFQSIRERRGLCYNVGTYECQYSDAGTLSVGTELEPGVFEDALRLVLGEAADIREHGLREEEILFAKGHIEGEDAVTFDEPIAVARDIVHQIVTDGAYDSPEAQIAKVLRVTDADVRRVARRHLELSKVHVAVSGPPESMEDVRGVVGRCLWDCGATSAL